MTTATLVSDCGAVVDLAVDRWRDPPDEFEQALLDGVEDPILDVGCGPGRIVAAVAAAGRVALGVDPSPAAIAEARRRGAPVLQRSVFEPLPGQGRWATLLLLDGNIGIGGDPAALLGRAAELLRTGGRVVVEVDRPGSGSRSLTVRIESGGRAGPWFPWARVGADAFAALARGAGLVLDDLASGGGRWFAGARKP